MDVAGPVSTLLSKDSQCHPSSPSSPLSSVPSSPLSSVPPSSLLSTPASPILDSAPRRRIPTERVSTQRKLQEVVNTLRRVRWSLKSLLVAWIGAEEDSRKLRVTHRTYGTTRRRRRAIRKAMDDPRIRSVCQPQSPQPDAFITELDRLIQQPYFGQFDHTADLDTLDFDAAFKIIEQTAPTWHAMLISLLSNQRAHRASYARPSQPNTILKRLFTITSIVCHSRAKKQSNFLSTVLGTYLVGTGVKRRVIETLAGLGLCQSYHQTNRTMAAIAQEAEVINSCQLLDQSGLTPVETA